MRQLVSIIIPVYNGEKTLRQCLNSVLNQSYNDYEVIVVDNNSTDKTKEIIQEFQEKEKGKNKKIRYFFEPIRKMGAARNTGEKKAQGKVILMTDSDCVVPKSWVKNMTKPIFDRVCDAVQGSEINIENGFWSKQTQLKIMEKIKDGGLIIGRIDQKNFAISTNILKKIGYTNRKYFSGMDTELAIRFSKNRLRLVFLKHVKVKHHHPNSLKSIIRKYNYRAYWCTIVTKDHKDYLKSTNFLKETNQTPWSFIKFFPGIIKTLILRGPAYMYFDLVTGLAWRIGLVYGWIKKYFISIYH